MDGERLTAENEQWMREESKNDAIGNFSSASARELFAEIDRLRAKNERLRQMLAQVEFAGFRGNGGIKHCIFCNSLIEEHREGCSWVEAMK